MVFRVSLENPEDLKFLKKRVGSSTLRALQSSQKLLNDKIIAQMGKDLQSDHDSSSVNDSEKPKRRSKYGNQTVFCNTLQRNIDSLWEHDLYHLLERLQEDRKISELKHQSHHDLVVNGHKICRLELDFEFIWLNKKIYVDAKSPATSPASFKTKVKLFTALFGEPVYLVERKKLGIYEDILYGRKK